MTTNCRRTRDLNIETCPACEHAAVAQLERATSLIQRWIAAVDGHDDGAMLLCEDDAREWK